MIRFHGRFLRRPRVTFTAIGTCLAGTENVDFRRQKKLRDRWRIICCMIIIKVVYTTAAYTHLLRTKAAQVTDRILAQTIDFKSSWAASVLVTVCKLFIHQVGPEYLGVQVIIRIILVHHNIVSPGPPPGASPGLCLWDPPPPPVGPTTCWMGQRSQIHWVLGGSRRLQKLKNCSCVYFCIDGREDQSEADV